MRIKLYCLLLLVSCGPQVKFKENKLEDISPLGQDQIAKYLKQGVLIKGEKNQIQYEGSNYTVSVYSSKACEEFINSVLTGSQTPVIFTGGISGNQIVIESIQKK